MNASDTDFMKPRLLKIFNYELSFIVVLSIALGIVFSSGMILIGMFCSFRAGYLPSDNKQMIVAAIGAGGCMFLTWWLEDLLTVMIGRIQKGSDNVVCPATP